MQSGNIVRNNRIFQNGSGIYAAAQSGAQIYNNLVYSNAGGSPFTRRGIFVRYSSTGTLVYFNTVYANQSYGISNGDGEGNSPTNSNIRDNILNGNGGTIEDTGTGTVNTNNLTTGLASNIWVNPGTIQTSDFHLKAGSPAINFGIAISGFPTDLDGVVRGNPPDAGAYEFV
jgi:parallel beta-helix repeat protein